MMISFISCKAAFPAHIKRFYFVGGSSQHRNKQHDEELSYSSFGLFFDWNIFSECGKYFLYEIISRSSRKTSSKTN
jgi:hypothetical protein